MLSAEDDRDGAPSYITGCLTCGFLHMFEGQIGSLQTADIQFMKRSTQIRVQAQRPKTGPTASGFLTNVNNRISPTACSE